MGHDFLKDKVWRKLLNLGPFREYPCVFSPYFYSNHLHWIMAAGGWDSYGLWEWGGRTVSPHPHAHSTMVDFTIEEKPLRSLTQTFILSPRLCKKNAHTPSTKQASRLFCLFLTICCSSSRRSGSCSRSRTPYSHLSIVCSCLTEFWLFLCTGLFPTLVSRSQE